MLSPRRLVLPEARSGVENTGLFLEIFDFPAPNFCDELPYFSKLSWMIHLQISHEARRNKYYQFIAKIAFLFTLGTRSLYADP